MLNYDIKCFIDSKTLNDSDFNKFVQENNISITEAYGKLFLEFSLDYSQIIKDEYKVEKC